MKTRRLLFVIGLYPHTVCLEALSSNIVAPVGSVSGAATAAADVSVADAVAALITESIVPKSTLARSALSGRPYAVRLTTNQILRYTPPIFLTPLLPTWRAPLVLSAALLAVAVVPLIPVENLAAVVSVVGPFVRRL